MNTPPNLDEIEVSFFGPGYGECIVVHLTQNEWLVVDSCVDPIEKKPIALNYFSKINVDPSQVKMIIASHWHDDHVRGISSIIDACKESEFSLSKALMSEEFRTVITAFGKNSMMEGSSGTVELYKTLRLLVDAKKTKSRPFRPPVWASENCRLYVGNASKAEIYALSPSDWALTESVRDAAKLLPKENEPKKFLVTSIHNNNHVAVVLWISIGDFSILLGSDLEEEGNPYTGWSAIVNSKRRPSGKALLFKVPHHGSITGHLPSVWQNMLNKHPISVLTPYSTGKGLPTEVDVARICSYTEEAYITASERISEIKKDPIAQKLISSENYKFSKKMFKPGHVRVRIKQENGEILYNVDLFDGAKKL